LLHRREPSGTLHGLLRVRHFAQDDSHIFCTEEQIQAEVAAVLEFAFATYAVFGIDVRLELSTRPEQRIGSDDLWDHSEAALLQALGGLQSQGLSVVAYPDQTPAQAAPGKLAALEIVGHDRPGIVREIARALAGQGVNVEELSSECASAPMSGETLFKATARLQLPEGCNLTALKTELEKIAADLLVDVSFAELRNQ